ncbi:ribosome maturation factor RimP [Arcanobacterium ihumii]|uniref:ribosome maturation factor RimP n=1 Tax=Arcanobacterium ihumii TaxID=2138162 RepID=UPI000F536DFC|nr:ribosome maturation factor RimP [Arcanobacterium ihumii]
MAEKNSTLTAALVQLLEPVVASFDLFLEDVKVVHAGKHTVVRVVVDLESGPGGIDSALLTDVSREISSKLDETDPISTEYSLEVSTPGADRALVEPRHYSRAVGRLIHMVKADGKEMTGRLVEFNGVDLHVVPQIKKNKQLVDGDECTLSLNDVAKARVVVELKKFEAEEEDR